MTTAPKAEAESKTLTDLQTEVELNLVSSLVPSNLMSHVQQCETVFHVFPSHQPIFRGNFYIKNSYQHITQLPVFVEERKRREREKDAFSSWKA